MNESAQNLKDRLRYHVTGAIERGEATAIEGESMSEFTAGPWSTKADNHVALSFAEFAPESYRIVWQENEGDIAYVLATDDDNGNSNARLIAAAPDLLDALKKAHAFLRSFNVPECEQFGPLDLECLDYLERAIKRACD